jgi:hypothetical protein
LKQHITWVQNSNRFTTHSFNIEGERAEQQCLYKIRFSGEDSVGGWTAYGFIGFSREGVNLWFAKNYNNKKRAGQTGSWSHLLYEGQYSEETNIFTGIWYYSGYEDDSKYSGTWNT